MDYLSAIFELDDENLGAVKFKGVVVLEDIEKVILQWVKDN